MVAPDTFEACDDIGHLHARHQPAEALQIAVASAIELHVGDNAVLHLHIDVAGAGTLGLVGGFHCYIYEKPTLTLPVREETWIAKHIIFQVLPHREDSGGSLSLFLFLLLLFLRLHVGVNRLHVVELFEAFNHLVDGGTLLFSDFLLVVGDVGELTTDVLESALFEVLLDS